MSERRLQYFLLLSRLFLFEDFCWNVSGIFSPYKGGSEDLLLPECAQEIDDEMANICRIGVLQ